MLLLLFDAGGARYGLEASDIVEVVPAAALRPVPRPAGCVAGLLDYHGAIVPVLDLTALLTGRPAQIRLSSRIIVVHFHAADGAIHLLGLLGERATETTQCRDSDFQPAGVRTPEAPFAGDILIHAGVMVQKVNTRELLPAEVQQLLFSAAANA